MPYLDGGLVMPRSLIISTSNGGIHAQLLLSNCSVQIGYGSLHSRAALISSPARARTFPAKTYSVRASQRSLAPCEASVRRNPDNAPPGRNEAKGIT